MKVYIAEISWPYEGSEVIGVFSTHERAVEVGEQRRIITGLGSTWKRGDCFDVYEWEVEE